MMRGITIALLLAGAGALVYVGGTGKTSGAAPGWSASAEFTLDTSALARVPGAKETYASPPTTIYTTPDSVQASAAAVLRLLTAAGWQHYEDPFSAKTEDLNISIMTFKKDRQGLHVFITLAPAQGNATSVSYTANAIVEDLPFPKDAAEIKFDPERPYLSLISGGTIDASLAFFQQGLASRGWSPWSKKEERRMTAADAVAERNDRGLFAFYVRENHRPILLLLEQREDGRTIAKIEGVPEELLRKPEPKPEVAKAPDSEPAQGAGIDTNTEATSKTPNPGEAFDALAAGILDEVRKATEQALTDIKVGPKKKAEAQSPAAPEKPLEELAAEEPALISEDISGLPVPSPSSLRGSEKSLFRSSVNASVPAKLSSVLSFYKAELAKLGWKESGEGAVVADNNAEITYTSPEGPAVLKLVRNNGETQSTLTVRKESEARKAGLLPDFGQSKLMFGNALEKEAILTIDKAKVKIAAGLGGKKPDGPTLDVAPGKHKYVLTVAGEAPQSDEIEVAAGDIWGLVVGPGGVLALQMY